MFGGPRAEALRSPVRKREQRRELPVDCREKNPPRGDYPSHLAEPVVLNLPRQVGKNGVSDDEIEVIVGKGKGRIRSRLLKAALRQRPRAPFGRFAVDVDPVNFRDASVGEEVRRDSSAAAAPVEHAADLREPATPFHGRREVRERPLAVGAKEVRIVAPGNSRHQRWRGHRRGSARIHREDRPKTPCSVPTPEPDDLQAAGAHIRPMEKREAGLARVAYPRESFGDPVELDRRLSSDRRPVQVELDFFERSVESEHPADDAEGIVLGLDDVEVTSRDLSELASHGKARSVAHGAATTRRPWFRFVLAVAFAAGAAGVLAAESRSSVQCSLDLVSERPVSGGSVTLIGWAAEPGSGAPVLKMDVWRDGAVRGDVLLSGYRPDVAAHFGRPGYRWSGWTATVSLKGVEPGPHRVEVVAYSRSGERVSCGAREVFVRSFPSSSDQPALRSMLVLLIPTIVLVGWFAFVGWGPMRMVGSRAVPVAAPAGLSIFAIAAEAGGAANMRPLAVAVALTGLSGILLAISARRAPIRLRRPKRHDVAILVIVSTFVLAGSIPLVRWGPGAVLGSISDATWESSVADSIARYGWKVPEDVHGLLAAVPSVWRAADFRAGVPYPLALLAQAFGVRAHAVHSVLTLAVAALVIWGTGALAGYLFRHCRRLRAVAVVLVATSSVLFSQLYHQHTGVLIAALLYLSFLHCLLALLPGRRFAATVPITLFLAGAWTLYPETMVLWFFTASLFVAFCGSWSDVRRMVGRLAVAAALAAVINPIGLARTVRFTNALRNATALATPELRTVFGDTHYFPTPAVMTGLRPYRIDSPAPSGILEGAVILLAAGLLAATLVIGLFRSRSRERRHVLLLLLPVSLWLVMNRVWEFPYGFSKGLPHLVPLWALALSILAARAASLAGRGARAVAVAGVFLLAAFSIRSSIDVIGRAVRQVPGYDPAFRALPQLAAGIDRNAIIVVADPLDSRREWIAYFLGELRVVRTREEASAAPAQPVYELFDRRGDRSVSGSRVVRSSRDFVFVSS